MRATLLPSWHYRVVDPPLRSDRFTPMENKVKLVQMLLSIVVNLSK